MKFLPIVIFLLFLGSCSPSIKQVNNPKQLTTLEVLENIDTTNTYNISLIDDKAYILNDKEVVYMLIQDDEQYINISILSMVLLCLFTAIIGVIYGLIVVYKLFFDDETDGTLFGDLKYSPLAFLLIPWCLDRDWETQ